MARGIVREKWVEWRERVQRFSSAGVSVGRFCEREGVSVAAFYQWRKKLEVPRDQAVSFVPVAMTAASSLAVESRWPGDCLQAIGGRDAGTTACRRIYMAL